MEKFSVGRGDDFWEKETNSLTNETEKRGMEIKELEKLSTTDGLTGLLNRREFEKRARGILAGIADPKRKIDIMAPRNIAIIIGDIDHFKSVNDTLGHDEGDKVLREVSRTIQENVRSEDLVARWGGEEFAILIVDGDKSEIQGIAHKLLQTVEEKVHANGKPVTMSLGFDVVRDESDLEAAIKRADQALYTAKREGRNRVEQFRQAA